MFLKEEMFKYIKHRHLHYFDIYYHDKNVSVDKVKEAVKKELDGPGKLLGYRAMYHKVRLDHELKVPRDLVHAAMYDLDPKGLEARGPVGKKKAKPKAVFLPKDPTLFIHWMARIN